MQNRYVGDIGDFAKFGLLRFLVGVDLPLGVLWYHTHDERHPPGNQLKISRDGNHIEYLTRTPRDDRHEFRDCDPELWEGLRDLVFRDARCIHCVEGSGLLPPETRFFGAMLDFPPHIRNQARHERRESWFRAGLAAVEGSSVVYLDPGTGIAGRQRMHHQDGPKFTYPDDLARIWNSHREPSLIVYHHLGMERGGEPQMVANIMARIREGVDVEPIPLLFHPWGIRGFFVVPQDRHRHQLEARVGEFLAGPWGQRFTRGVGP